MKSNERLNLLSTRERQWRSYSTLGTIQIFVVVAELKISNRHPNNI